MSLFIKSIYIFRGVATARFANKVEVKKLNQVTGVVLFVLGLAMLIFKFL